MSVLDDIHHIRNQANGQWEYILQYLDISTNRKESPCPACGGNTRYRFDDLEGRGTHYCSHCGAGDGLDLVMKVNGCNATKAAKMVAEAMALPLTSQEKPKKPAKEKSVIPIADRVAYSLKRTNMGESVYLKNKGLEGHHPLFKDGSLFLPIQRLDGAITGAQIIRPNGEKRLVEGTKKKGAFIPMGDIPEKPETVVITEGYATALSLDVVGGELVLAALDAGNLLSVAQAVRERWPEAIITIAGDNDVTPEGENVGKHAAEEAARAVSGLFAVPPTDHKADWNDYRQQNGVEALRRDFVASTVVPVIKIMNQVEDKTMKNEYGNVQTLGQVQDNVKVIHPERKTRLPMSVGSAGFDTQLDYVVKGLIPAHSLCSIYGPSGSYKSFLAGSWACHIATGKDWGERRVAHGSVMYVVGEGGIGVPRRIKAWEIVHGQEANNLYLVNTPIFPAAPMEIKEMAIAAKQVEAETGKPVRLIILDTLARCFGGSDENDAKDMGAFVRGCDELKKQTGATILVIHHSGKDESKGARGSSAFRAALDAEFKISRESDGNALVIACTKMKDAEEPEAKAYDLRVVELFTDSDGELVTSLIVIDKPREPKEEDPLSGTVSNKTDNHTALWQCIRSRTALKDLCTVALVRDDMKAMGIDIKHFRRWLAKLENEGLVRIDGNDLHPVIKEEKS